MTANDHRIYLSILNDMVSRFGWDRVLSLDLETLIRNQEDFLTGEQIIACSVAYYSSAESTIRTEIFISSGEGSQFEDEVLLQLDAFVGGFKPLVIIGYNHTGYDIPLLRLKMVRRSYSRQLWNLKYYLSTAYCPDMMYIIAGDLYERTGDYKTRKLSEVVIHQEYSNLPLMRTKSLAAVTGMPVNRAIEDMWKKNTKDFRDYCKGDVHDILVILMSLLGGI